MHNLPAYYLVQCCAQKADTARPARELYTSDWFAKARALVEANGDHWHILSAKYGLLHPDMLAGRDYREPIIGTEHQQSYRYRHDRFPWLARVEVPMLGLGIGQQKRWLMDNARKVAANA